MTKTYTICMDCLISQANCGDALDNGSTLHIVPPGPECEFDFCKASER